MLYRITILALLFVLPLFSQSAFAVVAVKQSPAATTTVATSEAAPQKLKLRQVFKMMRTAKKQAKANKRSKGNAWTDDKSRNLLLIGIMGVLLGAVLSIVAVSAFKSIILLALGSALGGLGLIALVVGLILLAMNKKK